MYKTYTYPFLAANSRTLVFLAPLFGRNRVSSMLSVFDSGFSCSFEDCMNRAKECWQIRQGKVCSVLRKGIADKPPKFPPIPIGDNTIHRRDYIVVDFLDGYQFSETLSPTLLEIVLFRLNDKN